MFKVRVIPCLDVKDGRVVKGVQFLDLRDAGDPVEAAIAYDAAGADELCFLDITASHENRDIIFDVVTRTAEACFMPLTVGGGVRTVEDIRKLLASGADKVSINTAAVTPRLRQGGGGEVRRPVHRGGDRRQEGVEAGRTGPLGDLHPWRPQPDRARRRRLCARGGGARRRRNPADLDGPRRHPAGLRHRAHPRDRRRGAGAGDRLGRRRQLSIIWSRASATAMPPRCWRPRSSISASTPSARPRSTWRMPACRCGSIRKSSRPANDCALRPAQRVFEPVVAPEHFAIRR